MTFLALFVLAFTLLLPPDGEPKARRGTFALTNATIETVTNGTIENGTLVIQNDRIIALGAGITPPADAEIIDCTGLTLYPGLIDTDTQLGLVEISAVPRTVDSREVGEVTPHVKAQTAINPNAVAIPVTRVGGVTSVLSLPTGGLLPGSGALINLHGYTPEQMVVAGTEVMVLNFPATGRRSRFDRRSEEDIKKESEKALKKLNDLWDKAELYTRIQDGYTAGDTKPEYVPEMLALTPVVRGEKTLIIKVNAAKDILAALDWIEKRGLDNVILSGVAEGWRVADKIAEAGVPVIARPTLSTPTRDSDRYDKSYANPGLMRQAGVDVALSSGETENVRNLPFNAGFAAAYGMGKEEALRAVTIVPAQMLGVADDLGSLEEGKKANLIVTDGDPFETATDIKHVFIDGYMIPMESRHTRLYDEFLDREPGLDKHPQPVSREMEEEG